MSSIDASLIGLRPTLQLLQQYYQSGVLQADVRSAFRMHDLYIAYIEILEGNIISCSLQDKTRQYEPVEIETLLRLDASEGPFAWRFYPHEPERASPASTQEPVYPQEPEQVLPESTQEPVYPQEQKQVPPPGMQEPGYPLPPSSALRLTPASIPRRVAQLDLNWLTMWSPAQQRILRVVYAMVDGQRTVAAIERSTRIPNADVQRALVILGTIQIITIDR